MTSINNYVVILKKSPYTLLEFLIHDPSSIEQEDLENLPYESIFSQEKYLYLLY
jgi:hypothetical protein